jgi:hypothetical protein
MRPIVFLIKDISCTASTQCGVVVNHALADFDINSSIQFEVDNIKGVLASSIKIESISSKIQ